jgi:regulator of protease activity HflC (stomatin/prohibitin superfamily)
MFREINAMSQERSIQVGSGWGMLAGSLAALLGGVLFLIVGIASENGFTIFLGIVAIIAAIFLFTGFITLQPNEAVVLLLFGEYRGTLRESGFYWANPFLTKKKVSLRLRSMEGQKLKVNDKQGNPIEIAAVIVWRVHDTAQATFDVDNYAQFVSIQSETAVRHLANSYAYDHGEENELTLRSGVDEVSATLKNELAQRLAKAGVLVEEARITHLAYAPEIAGVMLRRQQADAIIAARQKIVHGAVSMVQMALKDLSEQKVIELDAERKAAMVSNLLLVLCGERDTQPVISMGTAST